MEPVIGAYLMYCLIFFMFALFIIVLDQLRRVLEKEAMPVVVEEFLRLPDLEAYEHVSSESPTSSSGNLQNVEEKS